MLCRSLPPHMHSRRNHHNEYRHIPMNQKGMVRVMRTAIRIVLFLVKLALKILLLPVIAALTLAQWISFVAVCVTSGVFRLLGSIFIGTAVLSYAFGLYPISEMWHLLAIGAAIFLVPEVGEWLILRIADLNYLARHWLVS